MLYKCTPEIEIELKKEIEPKKEIEEEVEEKQNSLFLSSYRKIFISIYKREPNSSHMTAIKNLHLNGKPADEILAILEQTRGKYIREPEPYIYKTIKEHKPIEVQSDANDPNRPLEDWEKDWLEDFERRRKADRGESHDTH